MGTLVVEELATFHLKGLGFRVEQAGCVILSGPSGSGKSLLLRALADLDPHQGRVCLDDEEQCQVPAPLWRRRLGFLPADSGWWSEQVGDHFPEPTRSLPLLEKLGLTEQALSWQVSRLSSGERQRLALVRLLSMEPRALLLDEPTANLDRETTLRAEAIIQDYRQQRDAPVVWVTHDREQIERVGDRVLWLADGRLEERQA